MRSNPDPLYRRWTVVVGSTVGRVAISHPTMVWVVHLDTWGEWLGTRPHPPTARRSGSFANEPLNRDRAVWPPILALTSDTSRSNDVSWGAVVSVT